tara:strand:+ start:227 stop:475 length:249 start_codon:yes stop_codon:yes gene_type:complete
MTYFDATKTLFRKMVAKSISDVYSSLLVLLSFRQFQEMAVLSTTTTLVRSEVLLVAQFLDMGVCCGFNGVDVGVPPREHLLQ